MYSQGGFDFPSVHKWLSTFHLALSVFYVFSGMSNDCGTVFPYRNPAKKDADIIRQARAAGAIPIAVTNTPQLCMNWETYNNVTGLTTNPYDQKRTTGGSSGGEVDFYILS